MSKCLSKLTTKLVLKQGFQTGSKEAGAKINERKKYEKESKKSVCDEMISQMCEVS